MCGIYMSRGGCHVIVLGFIYASATWVIGAFAGADYVYPAPGAVPPAIDILRGFDPSDRR